MGCNRLADGSYLFLLDESTTPPPPIVYTLSIRRDLVSAKIEGELTVRSREAGDAYRYGGMTHKLKKLFSDKKIPQALRSRIPVLCDGRGIVWVPSFGVREDDLTHTERRLTVLYLASDRVTEEIARQLSAPQE
jgi:tRNA(Ile)-lysidine synthetase-like protein